MTAVEQNAMRPEPVEGRVSTSAVLSPSKDSAHMTGRVRRLGGAWPSFWRRGDSWSPTPVMAG